MGIVQVGIGDLGRFLVGGQCNFRHLLVLLSLGEFSDISAVVTFHFLVENLLVSVCGLREEFIIYNTQDVVGYFLKLDFYLALHLFDQG